MKTSLYGILIFLGGLLVVTAYLTLFTVHQTQQALNQHIRNYEAANAQIEDLKRKAAERDAMAVIPGVQRAVYSACSILAAAATALADRLSRSTIRSNSCLFIGV